MSHCPQFPAVHLPLLGPAHKTQRQDGERFAAATTAERCPEHGAHPSRPPSGTPPLRSRPRPDLPPSGASLTPWLTQVFLQGSVLAPPDPARLLFLHCSPEALDGPLCRRELRFTRPTPVGAGDEHSTVFVK